MQIRASGNPWVFYILTLCFTVACMETDIYVPSFPDMVAYFGAGEDEIQQILSYNFLGFCVSCMFYGPLSDSFGRKRVILTGAFIFMVSSFMCIMVNNLFDLTLWRFLQGVGAASTFSIGAAIFFDVYEAGVAARLIGYINALVGGTMAGAPLLGSWLNMTFGWQSNFILISILSALCFFSLLFGYKESLSTEQRKPLNVLSIARDYKKLALSIPFMFFTIAACLMFGVLIAYTGNLSLIFINHIGVSEGVYAFYQAAVLGTFAVVSIFSGRILEKIGMERTCQISVFGTFFGLALLAAVAFTAPASPLLITISMMIATSFIAISMGAFGAMMFGIFPDIKGAAGSMMTAVRMMGTAGLVMWVADQFDGTIVPVAESLLLCSAIAVPLYIIGSRVYNSQKAEKAVNKAA